MDENMTKSHTRCKSSTVWEPIEMQEMFFKSRIDFNTLELYEIHC